MHVAVPRNSDGDIGIKAVYRHPYSTGWATQSTHHDVALVLLDPASSGLDINHIQSNSSYLFQNGHMGIYAGANSGLRNAHVLAYGYGAVNNHTMQDGNLHRGWKLISDTYDNGNYRAQTLNDQGTSCPDDSGGPDFWWDGTKMELAGIHSGGQTGCGGGWDLNVGAEVFKPWAQYAAVMPMIYAWSNEPPLWDAAKAADSDSSTAYSSKCFSTAIDTNALLNRPARHVASLRSVLRVFAEFRSEILDDHRLGDVGSASAQREPPGRRDGSAVVTIAGQHMCARESTGR